MMTYPFLILKIPVKSFNSLNPNKAHGPDYISTKLLRTCANQLAIPFTNIFNRCISEHKSPTIWKTSELIPVPKKPKVKELNDLRPVALTSVLVKCLERLVLSFLLPSVAPFQYPSQYPYKCKRDVDDAISVFIDNIYRHIEGSKTFCRILFIDFSSAFNTIQPKILVHKLLDMKDSKHILCAWIFLFSYL